MLGTGRKVQGWGEGGWKQEVGHTIINSLKGGGGSFAKFPMETGLLLFKYLFLVHNFLVMVDYFVSESHWSMDCCL